MSNDELLASLLEAVRKEGAAIARVVALLIKVEDRSLHLELSYPNIFDFCRRHLGFSEDEAYRRKETARLARRFPQILDVLASRQIHMSALLLLRDVLTEENFDELIKDASGKTKSQVQWLVAQRSPRPDAPSSIRKLPEPRAALATHPGSSAKLTDAPSLVDSMAAPMNANATTPEVATVAPSVTEATSMLAPAPTVAHVQSPPPRIRPSAQVEPLSATRYRVQFTMSAAQLERLERARALTRHGNIEGDLAIVVDQAIALLIAKREKEKFAATTRPRAEQQRVASSQARPGAQAAEPRESVTVPGPDSPQPAGDQASKTPLTPAKRAVPAVPAATKREVVLRDGERCSFVGASGERCPAKELLELDHRHPRALGGSNAASNLRLLCRAHNQFVAERVFGREHMSRAIAKRRQRSARPISSRSHSAAEPEEPTSKQPGLPFT